MQRYVAAGVLLVVLLAGIAFVGGPLAIDSAWPLLLGAAVALVPGPRVLGRAVAFGVGLVTCWVAFALRAGMLPDVPGGRAVFLILPVAVVTVAAVVSGGRLALWAGLAGVATYGAAYQAAFVASPTDFATQSVATMTSVLLATAMGAVVAMLVRPSREPGDEPVTHPAMPVAVAGDEVTS
ncbi:MAG TPA: hypothetical protein VM307_16145 [Egibacteraceae bacterium]|nr:hypothetical protein [Egibacteraceae bacterium]